MVNGLELIRSGPVATIWLDRAERRNAMSASMWAALPSLIARAEEEPDVRVLVVRGRGEHFCAGADIAELGTALAADGPGSDYRATNAAAEDALAGTSLVTIAAIDGACVGGGVQLAGACDLRIATVRSRFGVTPAKLGITYPAASIERLAAIVGIASARRLLLTAELIEADEASRIGLVDRVVAADDLDSQVEDLCRSLCSVSSLSQIAMNEMLRALTSTGSIPPDMAERWEQRAARSPDLAEGLASFAARRPAAFGPRPTLDPDDQEDAHAP